MIETFCILMMVFCIVLFIVKGVGHAGRALCHRETARQSAEEQERQQDKDEVDRQWKEFFERYKDVVCEGEMKAIRDLTYKRNKTGEDSIILSLGKLRVKVLSVFYRKKSGSSDISSDSM